VLTDYKMPSLDGIEVIRRLRRIFGYEDVPIVCITWSTIAKSATVPGGGRNRFS